MPTTLTMNQGRSRQGRQQLVRKDGDETIVELQYLEGLGYPPDEITTIDPDALDLIVRQGIPRPLSGLPSRWKQQQESPREAAANGKASVRILSKEAAMAGKDRNEVQETTIRSVTGEAARHAVRQTKTRKDSVRFPATGRQKTIREDINKSYATSERLAGSPLREEKKEEPVIASSFDAAAAARTRTRANENTRSEALSSSRNTDAKRNKTMTSVESDDDEMKNLGSKYSADKGLDGFSRQSSERLAERRDATNMSSESSDISSRTSSRPFSRERTAYRGDGTRKSIYNGRATNYSPRQRGGRTDSGRSVRKQREEDPPSKGLWPDMNTFRNLLRNEASF